MKTPDFYTDCIREDKVWDREQRTYVTREINEHNKTLLIRFNNYLSAKVKDWTRQNYLVCLRRFAFFLEEFKNKRLLEEVTEDDLIAFINYLKQEGLKEGSINNLKIRTRVFYGWVNHGKLPEFITILKVNRNNNRKLPGAMLTEEDIKKMSDCAASPRDRAIIMTLYESGARVGELLNIKIKDVEFNKYGYKLILSGKTGDRKIQLVNSTPDMRNWLNFHPDKNNPEAFVWVITSEFHKKRYKKQLDYQAVYSILQDLGQKTEIKKDCNPHNFRHSRASLLANHLTEAQMNEFFGWSHWGKTAAIYTHISGRDIDEAILKANGVKKEETAVVTELMPKVCIRCRFMNSISNKFCEKCFFPLDSTAAMEMEKKEKLFYDNLMSGKTLEQVAEEIIQRKLEEMLKK